MRFRKWVVYEFDALPSPADGVRSMGRFFTKRAAERRRAELGPTSRQFVLGLVKLDVKPNVYYGVMQLPKNYKARRLLFYGVCSLSGGFLSGLLSEWLRNR